MDSPKAMQQQHQRRTGFAGDEGVEGQVGRDRDFIDIEGGIGLGL
jgi:hypothetical protein